MLGWFRSQPVCPVGADTRTWIDNRWKWLENQFGRRRLRNLTVVLPRPEFFPEPYYGEEEDVRRMLDRVCQYMGLDPATIELSLYDERESVHLEGWRSGTAGLYEPEDGRYRIWVEASGLDDPAGVVATLAHELGHVHLLGHGRISAEAEDHEPLTDLLTVFLGLGVFTANAVIRESTWRAGATSGWKIGRQGYLGMPVFGYALARFARARGEDGSAWSRELRLDVGTPFKQAMRFLEHEGASG